MPLKSRTRGLPLPAQEELSARASDLASVASCRSTFRVSRYWFTGVKVGARSALARRFRREGLKRAINPLSFPRPAEFRVALYDLAPDLRSGRVLDVGSPKLPVVVLARERPRLELHTTDILPDFIAQTAQFLRANGCGDRVGSGIHLEVEDARSLSYPSAFFDWVYSISVLEHVADFETGGIVHCGDSAAMQEIARVLKPGGALTLTVPFDPRGYWEEFTDGPVYERSAHAGTKTFYQRHYDEEAAQQRLIAPSGLTCESRVFLGEGGRFKVEPWWNRIPMKWKAPLLPLQGFAGNLLFRPLPDSQKQAARGLALRLSKPETPELVRPASDIRVRDGVTAAQSEMMQGAPPGEERARIHFFGSG